MNQFGEESEQERTAREKAEFEWSERNEEALREAKGEPPLDPFYGIDKSGDDEYTQDSQSYVPSTQNVLSNTDETYVPRSLDEVHDAKSFGRYAWQFSPQNNYTRPRNAYEVEDLRGAIDLGKQELRVEQLNARVEATEAQARVRHKDYDRLVDTHVMPLIEQDRRVFEMLYHMPDPAEGAYVLARIIANGGRLPNNTRRRLQLPPQSTLDRMSADEFSEWLNSAKEGVEEDEVDNSVEVSRERMKRANKMSLRDFEKDLDHFLAYGD